VALWTKNQREKYIACPRGPTRFIFIVVIHPIAVVMSRFDLWALR
jgi:hypothetical protein